MASLEQLITRSQAVTEGCQTPQLLFYLNQALQVRLTLENAKVALATAKADEVLKKFEEVVKDAEARKWSPSLAIRASMLFNDLPFTEATPRVAAIFPRYVIRDGKEICFKCFGNFKAISKPELLFHGKSFQPSMTSEERLEFKVAFAFVFSKPNGSRFIFEEGELKLSLDAKTSQTFKVTIGAFPKSPGTLDIHFTTDRTVRNPDTKKVQHMISSEKAQGNNDQMNLPFSAGTNPGWTIGGYGIEMLEARGDEGPDRNSPSLERADGSSVTYRATTRKKRFGTSGFMRFNIVLNLFQDVIVTDHHRPPQQTLSWGSEVSLPYPAERWDVTARIFDGATHVFSSVDTTTSPYVKVENGPGGFVLRTMKLDELENS